jgi:hypothetical protein
MVGVIKKMLTAKVTMDLSVPLAPLAFIYLEVGVGKLLLIV